MLVGSLTNAAGEIGYPHGEDETTSQPLTLQEINSKTLV
jgi:hypothetical protein